MPADPVQVPGDPGFSPSDSVRVHLEKFLKLSQQHAHLEGDVKLDEGGNLINEEGLPIVDITEPVADHVEPVKRDLPRSGHTGTLPPMPSHRMRRRLDWRKMADEAEAEERIWLAEQARDPPDVATDDDDDDEPTSPRPPVEPLRPATPPPAREDTPPPDRPTAHRRRSSASKRVTFDLPPGTDDDDPSASVKPLGRPMKDKVIERPPPSSRPAAAPPPSASASNRWSDHVGLHERRSEASENHTLRSSSTTAAGSEVNAGEDRIATSTAQRPIFGEVVEKPKSGEGPLTPDESLRRWHQQRGLSLSEEGDVDDPDEGDTDTDDSDDVPYDDDDDLEESMEQMDELMMLREAALAYHRERPDHVRAHAIEHDPDLEDDELVDEDGQLRYVNIGKQSRFRGGPVQTASLIIPSLRAARETEPPATGTDEIDFFADAALTPEDRDIVRARLQAIREGIDPFEAAQSASTKVGTDGRGQMESLPIIADGVRERTADDAAGQLRNGPQVELDQQPRKASRFRARQEK